MCGTAASIQPGAIMNHMTHHLDPRFEAETAPIALERIPTPFVWTPSRPTRIRVALVGGGTWGEPSTIRTLRASGHRVTAYASARVLVDQWQRQPQPFEVIVLDCGAEAHAILPALELLRAQIGGIAIVLISNDDPNVLAEVRRLSVEEVLERPVHPVALRAALASALLPRLEKLGVQGDTWNI
jgi:CheY-like chemotaxis protein